MELPSKFAGWLTVNRACNLRCKWCYAKPMGFSMNDDMRLELVQRAIDLFKGLPLENVILIGGEPTIHPDFFKIIKMIKTAGFRPFLVTNSLKFANKNFLQSAIKAGLVGITTSLKAGNDNQYYQFTGRRVFPTVMKAIDNINKSEISHKHKISVTVCKPLFENFDEIIEVIAKSNAESLSLDMERPIIVNNEIQGDGMATPREMADFFVRIYPRLVASGTRFIVKVSIPFCLFPEDFIERLFDNNNIISGCQIFDGRGIIVDPYGRILPCNHFCNNPIGQLGLDFSTAEGYYEFRQRPDVNKFYRIIASCPHQNCVDCKYWQYCGAGCRVRWLYQGADELLGNFQKGGNVA